MPQPIALSDAALIDHESIRKAAEHALVGGVATDRVVELVVELIEEATFDFAELIADDGTIAPAHVEEQAAAALLAVRLIDTYGLDITEVVR